MAGKPKGKEPLTVPVNLRISERHDAALAKRAEKSNGKLWKSDIHREALEAYLFPKRKKAE